MVAQVLAASAVPLLLAAAATDIRARLVPNSICVMLALDGVMIAELGHNLGASLLAMLCVFVPAVICWRHGLLGGGDTKLLAAVTLLVPAHSVPSLVLTIAITGGALALIYWTMMHAMKPFVRSARKQGLRRILRIERYRIGRGFSLPYAVAISGGTLFALGRGLEL